MAFSETALNAYVKRTYEPKRIDNSMTAVEDVTVKGIKKETDGSGDNISWLCDADDSFNGSYDFTITQDNATNNENTVGSKFLSDWMPFRAVAQISSDIINKTRNNDGAWARAVDVAMQKTMKGIAHAHAVFMQGKGWGEVSLIQGVSGSTFIPNVRSDITKYVKGMPLHFAASIASDALRSTTVRYVTGVSYTPGAELVTLSGTLAGVSAVNGDMAFIAGCREDSATPARRTIIGMNSWFPNQLVAIPATDSTLLTVNRALNTRLYGTFVDATGGGSVIDALIDGCTEAMVLGNSGKLSCFASKAVFAGVAKDLHSSVRYSEKGAKQIGTNKLVIVSDGEAEATLEISRTTNDNQIWGYDKSQIVGKSIGGWPHIDAEDGLQMCRQGTKQGYEVRWLEQAVLQFRNSPGGLRIQLV
jgi:hypothetical protein